MKELMPSDAHSAMLPARPIRWQSSATYLDVPLVSVAVGPDPARGESRGHARGIVAIGDIATGVLAIGGVANGLIAFGGLAFGAVALGGLGIGALAFGGLALGWYAFGGLAVGYVAAGGLAVGNYAVGGAAFGKHVLSGAQRDPQAVEFFSRFLHGQFFAPRRP